MRNRPEMLFIHGKSRINRESTGTAACQNGQSKCPDMGIFASIDRYVD
ncbi:MAG: hypothetical protein IPK76_04765 [Lewinellaceae bacterium]|nr:hypothetical protein [Lewinellaceae bacterium]